MSKVVVGTFPSRQDAERGAERLQRAGFSQDEISLVSRDEEQQGQGNRGQQGDQATRMSQASGGVTWGAGLGAGAGLLASAGALAIPGIGPILAAGPLAATLSGAAVGGLTGGLMDWGIPEQRGRFYEDRVKQGRVLAVVRCQDDEAQRAQQALEEAGAEDVETHQGQR